MRVYYGEQTVSGEELASLREVYENVRKAEMTAAAERG
jgi:hypothetical protein